MAGSHAPRGPLRLLSASLSSALVVAALSGAATTHADAGSASVVAATTLNANEFERRVLRQINKKREARQLRRVRVVDECLDAYAEDWAETLATTGVLVHRDQNVIIADCDLTWAGEVLARGTTLTPKETVRAWMDSSTHRAVIMKRRANRAGVGVRYDSEDRVVVVVNFGDAT